MSVVSLNKEKFEEIAADVRPVLVDFYADWCGPCRMVAPVVSQIAEEHPEYLVCKVNVEEESELAGQFGVMSIPTLVVLRGGKEVARSVGAKGKPQILALLKGE